MIFRGIDGSNDWAFGNGRQSYLTGEAAVAANIKTRLMTFLGECFFALDAGVDWWNLIGAKNPQAQANIILQCREIIIQSEGVVRINSIAAVMDSRRKLTLTFNIDTIFTRNLESSVPIPS